MIAFACPACGQKLRLKDDLAGQRGKCPHCKRAITVPREPGAAASASAKAALDLDLPTLSPGQTAADNADQKTLLPGARGARAPATQSPAPAARAAGVSPELYDFLAPAEAADEIGRLGGYRILKILGAGGMGVVYQAEDVALKRLVALKAMLPALAASASNRARFLREARAVAALEHENVVAVYQVGEDRSVPFLAMQFLKGETLEDRVRRDGRLPPAEVLRIGRETAAGLAAAHARGMVHRDIKPANLWLEGERGKVKVLDFGLARAAGGDSQLTQQGAIIGTPAYMAPEQGSGKAVDGRCDLFSLGCVLYRLCTGQLPFRGADTIATLLAVATVQPPPPRKLNAAVPAALSRLVMRLLEKKAADRPTSATAVVEELEAIERDPTAGNIREMDSRTDGSAGRSRPKPAGRHGRDEEEDYEEEEEEDRPARPDAEQEPARRWPLPWLIGGGAGAAIVLVMIVLLASQGGKKGEDGQGGGDREEAKVLSATGLHGGVRDIDITRDGRRLVSGHAVTARRGDGPGAAVIWDLAAREELFRLTAFTQPVHAVAFSPDSSLLATGTGDWRFPDVVPELKVWDLTTRKVVADLRGHKGYVGWVAFSPDGTRLASASQDGTVKVWDPATGQELYTCPGHAGGGNCVIFSPSGKELVSGSGNGTVYFWDASTGRKLRALRAHGSHIHRLRFAKGGTLLVSASGDNTLRIWDATTLKAPRTLTGHRNQVYGLAVSPDGIHIASSSADRTVRVWDVDSGLEIRSFPPCGDEVYSLKYTPDGLTLAASCEDGKIYLFRP